MIVKNLFKACLAVAVCALFFSISCSQGQREEAIDRGKNALSALNGGEKSVEKQHETPLIVQEQQRKEIIAQNTKWTPENQRKYPIEYCKAMQEDLSKKDTELEVIIHKVTMEINRVKRVQEEERKIVEKTAVFLEKAKAAYRKAESSNKWPMKVGEYVLSKEKAQECIVEASERIKSFQAKQENMMNQLPKLENKKRLLHDEQMKICRLKARIEDTISTLQTEEVVKSEQGIKDTLDSLADSLTSLAGEPDDVNLDTLIEPTQEEQRLSAFDAVMAE